ELSTTIGPAMLRKGCGKMAMDNSCTRITGEGSEHPPLTSCSKKATLKDRKSGQFICYKSGQFYLLLTGNKYDLISLDYILPGKISGMDVYHHIRKTNQSIPILFISGNIEFLESVKSLKQKDINLDHQSKPCQNKDYVKSINRLLESAFG
ncbi:MAG: response regulator, partial [Desulfobacterales bacterium]|nr:response regulator [Desulfobacterales bacterium]